MKNLGVMASLLVVGVVGWLVFRANQPDVANKVQSGVEQATVKTFSTIQNEVKNGAVLLDVRTAEEYNSGHFPGATNFEVQKMSNGEFPNVDKTAKIYVYCRSGNRSANATKQLEKQGFTNVTDLGGLNDVEKLGGKLAS